MSTVKQTKLKKVLETVPAGYLVDAPWLTAHGIAYETFRDYVKRGWLERVCRGVFRRPGPPASAQSPIDWKICLLSMQHVMHYDIHAGGMTALTQQGHAHYLRMGANAPVWVYGNTIPNWLTKLSLNAPIERRRTSLFADPFLGLAKGSVGTERALPQDWALTMSTPERAILEAMDELPHQESFHNLDMVFQSLTTLRPRVLSALLESCNRIKVKRLFFVFADRHEHSWRKHLDPEAFNLGSGDRALVKGGKIHPRYRIMVPEAFTRTEPDHGA